MLTIEDKKDIKELMTSAIKPFAKEMNNGFHLLNTKIDTLTQKNDEEHKIIFKKLDQLNDSADKNEEEHEYFGKQLNQGFANISKLIEKQDSHEKRISVMEGLFIRLRGALVK